jgi:CrcB protein
MPAAGALYLAVATGGALGAAARYAVSTVLARPTAVAGFPWSTFPVNVVGCVAFGLLAGALERVGGGSDTARAFLLAGVLGGFTTFSTFAFENVELLATGQAGRLLLNVAGQVVLGTAGLWLGFALTRA